MFAAESIGKFSCFHLNYHFTFKIRSDSLFWTQNKMMKVVNIEILEKNLHW